MSDKALLCGVNDYATITDLRGCRNDVQNMRRLLKNVSGFDEVRTLLDSEVTRDNILREWDWLTDARKGDRIVFHFSGHGSYTTDESGDEEDGVDELICLYGMDWNDPNTYLLDDDLRDFTTRFASGVRLTIVLDSCHSGTGTRMLLSPAGARTVGLRGSGAPLVDLDLSRARMSRGAGARAVRFADEDAQERSILAPRSRREARETVLVRYVDPPPNVITARNRAGVRRSIQTARAGDDSMNHVLLSGSRSDQTSADARIGRAFHGAFTYHFCKTVRAAGGTIDHQTLIRQVRTGLKRARFSQDPQLEPETVAGPLFQGIPDSSAGTTPEDPSTPSAPGRLRADHVTLIEQLIGLLQREVSAAPAAGRAAGGRALVYVHGICKHDAGYSDGWWKAMQPHLPAALGNQLKRNRHEVLWSDIVTPVRALARSEMTVERVVQRERLADDLRLILQDRAEREAVAAAPSGARGGAAAREAVDASRAVLGIPGIDCIDDFTKYLLNEQIRREVLDRFRRVVAPLLRAGFTVDVISHSWGTVVAYEGLWSLAGESTAGRVANFFTVGSALSIGPIKSQVRPESGGRPPMVARWVNLDARGDVVGGALRGRPFQVDQEHLGLKPVGCGSFFGFVSPACAHSSYFDRANRRVNRGIFARNIANG